jgi:hypothetical protein
MHALHHTRHICTEVICLRLCLLILRGDGDGGDGCDLSRLPVAAVAVASRGLSRWRRPVAAVAVAMAAACRGGGGCGNLSQSDDRITIIVFCLLIFL